MLIKILILFSCLLVVSVYIRAYEPDAPPIIMGFALGMLQICNIIGSIWLKFPLFSHPLFFPLKVVSVIMPLLVFIWIKKKFLKCEKEFLSRFGFKLPREDFFFFFFYFPCLILIVGHFVNCLDFIYGPPVDFPWTCLGITLGIFYVTEKYNRQVCFYYCIFLVVYFYMWYNVLVLVLVIVKLYAMMQSK